MKLQKEIKISPKSEICEVKVAKSVKPGSFEVKIPIGDTFAYLYMDKKALKSLRGVF